MRILREDLDVLNTGCSPFLVFFFSLFLVALDNVFEIAFEEIGIGPLYILFVLAVFTPALAATARRLHDVGKSVWTLLILLVPIVGVLWVFLQLIKDSDPGSNDYGPCPKPI